MTAIEELKSKIQIDLSDLSTTLIEQPMLYLEAKSLAVTHTARADTLKRQRDEITAGAYSDARTVLGAGGKKPTEAQIQAYVTNMDEVKDINSDYLEASTLAKEAEAVAGAYLMRASMLKELTSLHGNEYRASREAGDIARQAHREARHV